MNFIPQIIRCAWRRVGLQLGWVKPLRRYEPDPLVADTINLIVNSDAAYVVAAETRQAMIQILSYMEKNNIPAVGVCNMDLGPWRFPAVHATCGNQVHALQPDGLSRCGGRQVSGCYRLERAGSVCSPLGSSKAGGYVRSARTLENSIHRKLRRSV